MGTPLHNIPKNIPPDGIDPLGLQGLIHPDNLLTILKLLRIDNLPLVHQSVLHFLVVGEEKDELVGVEEGCGLHAEPVFLLEEGVVIAYCLA